MFLVLVWDMDCKIDDGKWVTDDGRGRKAVAGVWRLGKEVISDQ